MLEEARFVIETHVSYSEETGPAEGGRVGFAIGDRVFWTDAYFNEPKWKFELKREYAQAIVMAINEGRLLAQVPPAQPAPVDGWISFDYETTKPPKFAANWLVDVRFKGGTGLVSVNPDIVAWPAVVAYRDAEIPF